MRAAAVAAALLLSGCGEFRWPWAAAPSAATRPGGPTVALDVAGATPSTDVSDLAAVLAEAATADGRVDPSGIARLGGRLDAQLARFAVTGPTATPALYPTYGSRWAYWYNVRAAWSMKLAALCGCPRRVSPEAMRWRRFVVDGREMSLPEIDAILAAGARRSGDFRLAACAPGVQLCRGPMPRRPLTAADFGPRLATMLSRLVLDERRFEMDVAARTIAVPPMLWACRDLLRARYEREYGLGEVDLVTALRPYVSAEARGRLGRMLGYEAAERACTGELAIPRRRRYYPGKIGKVEP